MKIQNYQTIGAILLLLAVSTAIATVTLPFPGWERLTQRSPDIIIAHCTETPVFMKGEHTIDRQNWIDSKIEIVSILKGSTNWGGHLESSRLGAAQLGSEYCPKQGEFYLIFSICHDGYYQVSEPYRIVPLGLVFRTNYLSGKTLDEQIQMLLQRRLDDLNLQMKTEQEEKQRLEEGLKKQ